MADSTPTPNSPDPKPEAAANHAEGPTAALQPHPGPQAPRDQIHRWIREKIARFARGPGVYLMKDAADTVLYIGKARSLRERVASYFQPSADLAASRGPHIAAMVENQVCDVDCLDCDSEVEALLTENRLIKDIQPPYNDRLRDDKSFPYLMITTGQDFPGVYVTRQPQKRRGFRLFGPFTSAAGVRAAANALQKVYKFRTCELEIADNDDKRRFFRPCLLHAINQCTAPCAALISRDQYRADIDDLITFLNSKRSTVLRDMTRQMTTAAAELRYEDAARMRDRIKAIQALSLSGDPDDDQQPEAFHQDPRAGLNKLAELLGMDHAPRSVEGIDIAHLHGQETVGALVCFIDGVPFKAGYKRFRIQTVQGVDDFASIAEVVARRYRHAAISQELYPDIILIDGGLGQLHAALAAFERMRDALKADQIDMAAPPRIVSLAKKEELIFTTAGNQPIELKRNNPALRLLQAVRDEAHRFGQHYHHLLRAKRAFDEDVQQGRRPPRNRRKTPAPARADPPPPSADSAD